MSLSRAMAAFAAEVKPAEKPATLEMRLAVVASVTAGAAADGHAQVTVTIGVDTFPAPYYDSYLTPTVGDRVDVSFRDGSPLIMGRVIGAPTF